MRKWFINLKLSKKFSFLIMLVVISLFLIEMFNRQYAYNNYNQKIYMQNARILSFYVNYIETVFDRIEAVTYAIAGDQNSVMAVCLKKKILTNIWSLLRTQAAD